MVFSGYSGFFDHIRPMNANIHALERVFIRVFFSHSNVCKRCRQNDKQCRPWVRPMNANIHALERVFIRVVFHTVMCPKDADRMANSVDRGSTLFAKTYKINTVTCRPPTFYMHCVWARTETELSSFSNQWAITGRDKT